MNEKIETSSTGLKAKSYGLCLEPDSFLDEKTIWIAVLSNGLSVYQDDDRPGVTEPCAWKRLGKYVSEDGLDVIGVYIKFRSHTEKANISCENQDSKGVYFSYGIIKSVDDTVDRKYYTLGFYAGDELKYDWFLVPEIVKTDQTTRRIEQKDLQEGRVIMNSSCCD
jgi:hypothetical protein